MRIDTIAIDGFGRFHDRRLSPAPGLTVVRGPNEAGKTTLLAFTRAMLFGFETNAYPALRGGKRGGWLDVEMADGRKLRIERYGERGGRGRLRVIENDADLGRSRLAQLLQGVEFERLSQHLRLRPGRADPLRDARRGRGGSADLWRRRRHRRGVRAEGRAGAAGRDGRAVQARWQEPAHEPDPVRPRGDRCAAGRPRPAAGIRGGRRPARCDHRAAG